MQSGIDPQTAGTAGRSEQGDTMKHELQKLDFFPACARATISNARPRPIPVYLLYGCLPFIALLAGCSPVAPEDSSQVELTVEIRDGNGAVEPGSGTYEAGSEVTLTALPETDWALERWSGDLSGGTDRYSETVTFVIEKPMVVGAHFNHYPGISTLDLVGDFAFFLQAIGSSAGVDTFDRNGIDYTTNDKKEIIRVYAGNGVPDVAELYLIEAALKNPKLSLSHRSAISHGVVWTAWQTNLAQAMMDLPAQDDRFIRIVAAYMTLGDFDTVESLRDMLRSTLNGLEIEILDYDMFPQRYFRMKDDADNDGVPNVVEWAIACPDRSLANLETFGKAATDGEPIDIELEQMVKIMDDAARRGKEARF